MKDSFLSLSDRKESFMAFRPRDQKAVEPLRFWLFTEMSAGVSDARSAPPVTAKPLVGTNIPMLNVVPEGADAIGMIGKALAPGRTEVEM